MNAKNLKTLIAGLVLGACMAAMATTHEQPRKDLREPLVLGHRVTPQGDTQLVYAKP